MLFELINVRFSVCVTRRIADLGATANAVKEHIGPTSPKPVALLGADVEFAGRGPGVRHAVGRMMTLN